MSSSRRLLPGPRAVCRRVADEAVLLHLDSGRYYGLDPVGRRVWELLVEHGGEDQVIAAMLGEFDVDEPRLRADVSRLIDDLVAEGLLTTEPAASDAPSASED